MKKTIDELTAEFRSIVGEDDRDEVIAFLEDLTDSYAAEAPDPEAANRITELEGEVSAWRKRYRDRFYGMTEDEEVRETETETDEKPNGEKIKIDDLFTERKD